MASVSANSGILGRTTSPLLIHEVRRNTSYKYPEDTKIVSDYRGDVWLLCCVPREVKNINGDSDMLIHEARRNTTNILRTRKWLAMVVTACDCCVPREVKSTNGGSDMLMCEVRITTTNILRTQRWLAMVAEVKLAS